MEPQRLWAPWRANYITGLADASTSTLPPTSPRPLALPPGGDASCFLCRCVAEPAAAPENERASIDRDNLVLFHGPAAVALLNRYPYNAGHMLVAPRSHKADLADLSPAEQLELTGSLTRLTQTLSRALRPDGFNIGLNLGRAAGAGVPGHLHWHIVPRWNGDNNFMPVACDTRVISQSLDAMWQQLRSVLENEAD